EVDRSQRFAAGKALPDAAQFEHRLLGVDFNEALDRFPFFLDIRSVGTFLMKPLQLFQRFLELTGPMQHAGISKPPIVSKRAHFHRLAIGSERLVRFAEFLSSGRASRNSWPIAPR